MSYEDESTTFGLNPVADSQWIMVYWQCIIDIENKLFALPVAHKADHINH